MIGCGTCTFSMTSHYCYIFQVDELTKMVNQISVHVDQIKHNHNVILASFQNQATKDETETLMDEVKKTSHRIHNGLKSE